MIHVNVIDGKVVGYAESNAPIPNRVTRTVTTSGNYGLADGARKMFKSLCVVSKDEKRDEAADELTSFMAAGRGRGRGRGRPLRPFDPLPKPEPPTLAWSPEMEMNPSASPIQKTPTDSICEDDTFTAPSSKPEVRYVTECLFNRGQEVRASGLVTSHSKKTSVTHASKPSKANGYVMYLHYMKKVNGETESKTTDQLIRMYDKDWKALTEDERKAWREKAKATRPARPPPDNAASSRFQSGPPTAKNVKRANAIARSLTAAGLVNDGDDSDDDYF
ncbi:unnamed protein product [Orchesella dallaii]|uniref:HMG box domain-containing protein n=1 Tax=Orchesella dallaii TaxID=48710 RepID=A0ABP1Q8Z1_9HEXA